MAIPRSDLMGVRIRTSNLLFDQTMRNEILIPVSNVDFCQCGIGGRCLEGTLATITCPQKTPIDEYLLCARP